MSSSPTAPARPAATNTRWLTVLVVAAAVTTLGAAIQAVLGLFLRSSAAFGWHEAIGGVVLLASVVAAVAAFLRSKQTGNKGLLMHAAGIAVLALIQFALGEMGVELIHILLGLALLVGAGALLTLALRKPHPAA